jgi:hypothetical protein
MYGGLGLRAPSACVKLEEENRKLKKLFTNLLLDELMLQNVQSEKSLARGPRRARNPADRLKDGSNPQAGKSVQNWVSSRPTLTPF